MLGTLALLACTAGQLKLGPSTPADSEPEDSEPVDSEVPEGDTEVEGVPAAEDPSERLFSGETVPVFNLILGDAALAALSADPTTYVEGALEFEGRRYDSVGVRLKGENSFMPISQKAAFKVKLDKYVEGGNLLGLQELTFNNMASDPTFLHEAMGYRHFREAEHPAARSAHAWLQLNGEDYALMAFVENIDKRFLARWFDDPDGSLFEVWDVDFRDEYIASFELEEGEDDHSMLQGLADALELQGDEGYEAAAQYVNWERFVEFWASEIVVGQFDSYPYSNPGDDCHVYADPSDGGRLVFIPHGMDETYYDPSRDILGINGRVGKRCLQNEACKALLLERITWHLELEEDIGQLAAFDAAVSALEDLISADQRKPYDMNTVRYYQGYMRDFISGRADSLDRWLED